MSYYDALDDHDFGYKECPKCEGEQKWATCCNQFLDDCDCEEEDKINDDCPECSGEGEIPRTFEDYQDEIDYWAEMHEDDRRHGLI